MREGPNFKGSNSGRCSFAICVYDHNTVFLLLTRRLHRRSPRLPTRRKWARSGYLGTTAQAGADISWS